MSDIQFKRTQSTGLEAASSWDGALDPPTGKEQKAFKKAADAFLRRRGVRVLNFNLQIIPESE